MKLWLVRHARPLVPAGICYGASDVPADADATLHAARALAELLPQGLAVRSSPLRRCRQLAAALQTLRPDLVAQPDARIAEMDFGAWEGQAWDAIGRPALDQWAADFPRYRCGGGECVSELMARVSAAWDEARLAGDEAVWITHAGVVRAARLLAVGVRLPRAAAEWPRQPLDFGAWDCLPF